MLNTSLTAEKCYEARKMFEVENVGRIIYSKK